MKYPFSAARARSLIGISLILLSVCGAFGEEKVIRLRNELIRTGPKGILQSQNVDQPANGLFIVQFEGRVETAWREILERSGVTLLRAVPEDAFIVRLKNAQITQLRDRSFIRYAGPYRAEHKLHSSFQSAPLREVVPISVLFAPDANGLEVTRVQRLFQRVFRFSPSRYGHVMHGEVTGKQLAQLSESASILWIEPAAKPRLYDEVSAEIVAGAQPGPTTAVQKLGFDGRGVTVAVADSGLSNGNAATMHPDLAGRVDEFFFYGNLSNAADEHSHGTHVSGIIAGNGVLGETDENGFLFGLGVAPMAHLVAQRIFDGQGASESPSSNEVLTHDAVRAGALIGSNSWGDDTQGRYDINAMEFDGLVRDADKDTPGDQPYILEFSAGNAGPGEQSVGSPAVAKNVIATGASENNRLNFFIYGDGPDAMADFSSRGPCEDGRIKPDVVAPGTWIASLQSASASDNNAWLSISPNYQYQGGTSQAGPHASGAAAVFVQYYRETHAGKTPSPALVKAALINSAVDMDDSAGTKPVPNNSEGWGRIDLSQMIGAARKFDFTDQTALLRTGDIFEKRFIVADPAVPLKITLVYTDVPGLPAAIPALVNDLDLEVAAPDGTIYRGNQFLNGESTPNAPGTDIINNVEGLQIAEPMAGEYIARIKGRNVVEDSRRDTAAIDQDFALIISGSLPLPGQGVVGLDRRAYTAPSVMQIKLIDFDLAGKPFANVIARSASETNGLAVQLQPFGPAGVFTGSVNLAMGPPLGDAKLQVNDGDLIEVIYHDVSPSQDIVAVSVTDLRAPLISDLGSTNQFGKQVISWTTDEPATSIIRYGTNGTLALSVTNSFLSTRHDLGLSELVEGATYEYEVIARDEAGNWRTNDNNGKFYTFVAKPAATVLLVDAYTHGPDDKDPSELIPIAVYTDALDQTGVTYEVWNTAANGSPRVDDLRPFRVVIWRINDSFFDSNSTLNSSQQTVISNYLSLGGSFFMSSMEILSRVGDVPFRTNVLHVGEFITNPSPVFSNCATCDEDHGVASIQGSGRDPISSGILVALDYSAYPVLTQEPVAPNVGPDISDTFLPATNAAAILIDADSGRKAGIRYPKTGEDGVGRVVFLSFPLDAVPMTGSEPNTRSTLLRNILNFLAPGLNGFGTIALDSTNYTIPAQVVVEVADSDPAGHGNVPVQFFSSSTTNGQSVLLTETARPGLFRGFITLVFTNQAASAGRLPVKPNDAIWVEYYDQSSKSVARAFADVDTRSPQITGLKASPSYERATISWDTTEPADALVQFGESTFLGRTAYRPDLETNQELGLTGLQPDRLYYYQVVSRDNAGNRAIDDNGGKLHTFQTLKPIVAPWSDDFERTNNNWTVFTDDGSDTKWQLGPPTNGLESSAHSGHNVWGSNLDGHAIEVVGTFLIGPPIQLSGGNTAMLRFWHSYDFTVDSTSEIGQVLVLTNTDSTPVVVAQYDNLSNGWELNEIDLTPYLGHVVQLVWHYELIDFAAQARVHQGWLIDDISVTITNLARGRIEVTNNLAQAAFTVAGPSSFNGQGWSFSSTNALTGEYVISYSNVPFYETPPPQTNTLTAGSPLVFRGRYTFPDGNTNGISDLWEQKYFGAVSSARSRFTDTDADGASDYAEFIAGTDPADPSSRLLVSPPVPLPGGRIRLDWSSAPGMYYRVQGTTNGIAWTPYSGWIRSSAMQTSYIVPPLNATVPYLFHVEVAP